jgi:hypothetical protein
VPRGQKVGLWYSTTPLKPHCAPETQNPSKFSRIPSTKFFHTRKLILEILPTHFPVCLFMYVFFYFGWTCIDLNQNFGIGVHIILQCPIELYLFLNAHVKSF